METEWSVFIGFVNLVIKVWSGVESLTLLEWNNGGGEVMRFTRRITGMKQNSVYRVYSIPYTGKLWSC